MSDLDLTRLREIAEAAIESPDANVTDFDDASTRPRPSPCWTASRRWNPTTRVWRPTGSGCTTSTPSS